MALAGPAANLFECRSERVRPAAELGCGSIGCEFPLLQMEYPRHDLAEEAGKSSNAGHCSCQRHQWRVAISDVCNLVRKHGFELIAPEPVEEPLGHANAGAVDVASSGKGIRFTTIGDVEPR